MAQTKRRSRRRKHRGTQAGTIDRRSRTSRPRSRAEARGQFRSQRAQRLDQPPSWRGATTRGAIAAAIFCALLLLAFRQPAGQAVPVALFMLLLYIPLGYFTDLFLYRRRLRKRGKQVEESR